MQPTPRARRLRQFAAWLRFLTGVVAAFGAQAQTQPQEPAHDSLVTPTPEAASPWTSAQAVARLFERACVQHQGQASAAVDWALSQGFEPADLTHGNTDSLLSGQPGSVLAAPGSAGRVLLAAAQGQLCTVWVEQMAGPPLRLALAEMLANLGANGARVKL
ncbi:MAG TPA: hypothetical protein VE029_15275, partial [Rhizobacter sp.]|nr:hypothetical protein [Rhizobacter sp.]